MFPIRVHPRSSLFYKTKTKPLPANQTCRRLPGAGPSFPQPLILALLLVTLVLSACSSKPYRLKDVAKTDIDMVADVHLKEIDRLMRELVVKLYRRNPRELAKAPGRTIETRLAVIFDRQARPLAELFNRRGPEAMLLCFDEGFAGDRVLALMAGLCDMVYRSYNDKSEFFLPDTLDQQLLYNSARNIEILVWRLGHRLDRDGQPFVLTNNLPDEQPNLSFERLFGKMIAIQDMMALIMEDRTNRTITRVVHGVAAFSFLPVGF